jgi:dTMP kinase
LSVLIAIEGIDGSGKGTQAARLNAHLQATGRRSTLLSFPRYQQTAFGQKVGDFLNGRFGTLDSVHPLLVSLLFAGDRFESRDLIQQAMADYEIVICDRYVASNVAHQGAKVSDHERPELINWIQHLEYGIYKLPAAQLTLFLDVPVENAQQLIAAKARRTYTEKAADLQEADANYLGRVREVYLKLASEPQWARISCLQEGQLRTVDEISSDIIYAVQTVLSKSI